MTAREALTAAPTVEVIVEATVVLIVARLAVSALHAAEAVPQVPVAAEATPQDATRRTDVTVTTTAATVTVPEAATASVMVRMTVSEMTSATPRTTVTATRNARVCPSHFVASPTPMSKTTWNGAKQQLSAESPAPAHDDLDTAE